MKRLLSIWILSTLLLGSGLSNAQARTFPSTHGPLKLETKQNELHHPWGMAFLDSNRVLVTERRGKLLLLNLSKKTRRYIGGLPPIVADGQGGLLDVALDPNFETNRWVYLSYSGGKKRSKSTHVGRGQLKNGKLQNFQVIFRAGPKMSGPHHFGSRLVFSNDGHLFISLGDRGKRELAQDPSNHAGSMIRILPNGKIPKDNPFVNKKGFNPKIYSYGHRNMQGAAKHPTTGVIWAHEHGPRGGDELNIIRPGRNYGWPKATYGKNYSGTTITKNRTLPGIQSPVIHWTPSIAPCGMAFVTGPLFPKWNGDILVGALKHRKLVHLSIRGESVIQQEILLESLGERIRDVEIGPDGAIYLLTDDFNGRLLRLAPQ